jgi:hypothetical protein
LTPEQYYSVIKNRLKFTPTMTPRVFVDKHGLMHNVPRPERFTSEQREEIIEKLKQSAPPEDD